MALTLTDDPIMSVNDARTLLDVSVEAEAILVINALSEKLKRYLQRVQINLDTDNNIVERIRPYGGQYLHLHAPIWTGAGFTIEASVYSGGAIADTYTFANDELQYTTSDQASKILLVSGQWPDETLNGYVEVTYKGGWATVPADVVQGAVMQGRVDLRRIRGEVGVTSRGVQGESTQYQTAGLIRECLDLWQPYRVMI